MVERPFKTQHMLWLHCIQDTMINVLLCDSSVLCFLLKDWHEIITVAVIPLIFLAGNDIMLHYIWQLFVGIRKSLESGSGGAGFTVMLPQPHQLLSSMKRTFHGPRYRVFWCWGKNVSRLSSAVARPPLQMNSAASKRPAEEFGAGADDVLLGLCKHWGPPDRCALIAAMSDDAAVRSAGWIPSPWRETASAS